MVSLHLQAYDFTAAADPCFYKRGGQSLRRHLKNALTKQKEKSLQLFQVFILPELFTDMQAKKGPRLFQVSISSVKISPEKYADKQK